MRYYSRRGEGLRKPAQPAPLRGLASTQHWRLLGVYPLHNSPPLCSKPMMFCLPKQDAVGPRPRRWLLLTWCETDMLTCNTCTDPGAFSCSDRARKIDHRQIDDRPASRPVW
jgi:hypothetical protein